MVQLRLLQMGQIKDQQKKKALWPQLCHCTSLPQGSEPKIADPLCESTGMVVEM
jgi:hypothetical protein